LNDVETPQIVKDKIVRFSCGGYHMMAIDNNGELWSWGSGMYGETG
jgi:alpha-tubulin suppressor-like RCC1 family protein